MTSQNSQLPIAARHTAAQEAVRLWPLEAQYRLGLASLGSRTGNVEEVDSQFLAAVFNEPDNPWLWATWGALYAQMGRVDPQQYSKAEAAFRQALALAPNVATFHAELGRVLAEQGQLAAGVVHLERAVDLDTTDVMAYKHLANLYTMLNRPADAAEAHRQARYWANKIYSY